MTQNTIGTDGSEDDAAFVERMDATRGLVGLEVGGREVHYHDADFDRLIALARLGAGRASDANVPQDGRRAVPPAGAPGLSKAELDAIEVEIKSDRAHLSAVHRAKFNARVDCVFAMARASQDGRRAGMLRAAEIVLEADEHYDWIAGRIRAEADAITADAGGVTELAREISDLWNNRFIDCKTAHGDSRMRLLRAVLVARSPVR